MLITVKEKDMQGKPYARKPHISCDIRGIGRMFNRVMFLFIMFLSAWGAQAELLHSSSPEVLQSFEEADWIQAEVTGGRKLSVSGQVLCTGTGEQVMNAIACAVRFVGADGRTCSSGMLPSSERWGEFFYVNGTIEESAFTRRDLVESHGAQLVIFTAPFKTADGHNRLYRALKRFCAEKGICYLNLLDKDSGPAMDGDYEFADDRDGHLNVYGAEKVTRFLGAYLMEHYSLETMGPGERKVWDMARPMRNCV